MRGGDVERDGTLTRKDFIFYIGNTDTFRPKQNVQQGYHSGTIYTISKELYNSIPEYILKEYKRHFRSNIKYIFFSKILADNSSIKNNNSPNFDCKDPRYKYEYVVFLGKSTLLGKDKPIFKNSNLEDILISNIPTHALKKLQDYLSKRSESNDINKAVNEELHKNNREANFAELNDTNK